MVGVGEWPHGTTVPGPACTEFMGTLDMHPLSHLLWRRLKPLVLGKLLFAPDTPFTRQLMAQVRAGGVLGPPSAQVDDRPGWGWSQEAGASTQRRGCELVSLALILTPATCR